MNLRNRNVNRVIAIAAVLAASPLLTAGACDDAKDAACADYSCPADGVAEGNFAITGSFAIDAFFKSVVNFGNTATGVAAEIRAELKAIQLAFGISDAELSAAGSLGAAIDAKLTGTFKAELTVDAQPARCEVDAQVTAQATVDCQASANCEVDPGMASVSCMGTCTAEVNAMGMCSAEAELKCEVRGPSLTCMGECSGTCSVDVTAMAGCEGSCNGTCEGTCSAAGDANGDGVTAEGECTGRCDGMCTGKCEVAGMAAAQCSGTCNGSCKATAPEAGCTGGASATCEFEAKAEAKCEGSCEGEFEPPKAMCEASASCEASAKADAKFSAKCEPPSIDVNFQFTADVDAEVEAQFKFAIETLRLELPRLLASLEKGKLVAQAGADLGSKGATAVKATLNGVADGDVDLAAAFKIGKCAPAQLDASASVITESGKELAAQIEAAGSLTASLGM